MSKNLIYRTCLLEYEPHEAANIIGQALGLEPFAEGDMPESFVDRTTWFRAPHELRCQMIGDWLKSVAYQAADDGQKLVPWTPIGGEKYANQND